MYVGGFILSTKKVNKKSNLDGTSKRKIIMVCIIIVSFLIIVYSLYTIINLIISPTDSVIIDRDIIYNEESAIRLCNKG